MKQIEKSRVRNSYHTLLSRVSYPVAVPAHSADDSMGNKVANVHSLVALLCRPMT